MAVTGPARLRTVELSEIRDLPVQTRHTSQKLIKAISETAKEHADQIRPVHLGSVGGHLYVVNEFEAVAGMRNAGARHIDALVTEYPAMRDLLADHVEKNHHPQSVDPLLLRDVINHMIKNDGISLDEACDTLMLHRFPSLKEAARAEITDGGRTALRQMLGEVSRRMYFVVTPLYYVNRLARIRRDEQDAAGEGMKAYTLSKMKSDKKSSWPSIDIIDGVLEGFHAGKKIPPTEERISRSGDPEDLSKKRKDGAKKKKASGKGSKPAAAKQEDKKTVAKAAKYIAAEPNLIYVPMEGDQPDLLFHKKTCRVAETKEAGGTYAMVEHQSKPAYVLPDWVLGYLGIDVNDGEDRLRDVTMARYATVQKAQAALAKAKDKDHRCVVLSLGRLPRR